MLTTSLHLWASEQAERLGRTEGLCDNMNTQLHPSQPASLVSGSRNRVESRELVRPEPSHKHHDKLALGSRAFDDVVGAVGGCFRAERHELVFSHRHNLLTSNRGTPFHSSLIRAEVSASMIRVTRPPSIIVWSGTGIQVPRRFPPPSAPFLVCISSSTPALTTEPMVCATKTTLHPLVHHG